MQRLLPHGGSLVDVPLSTEPTAGAHQPLPTALIGCRSSARARARGGSSSSRSGCSGCRGEGRPARARSGVHGRRRHPRARRPTTCWHGGRHLPAATARLRRSPAAPGGHRRPGCRVIRCARSSRSATTWRASRRSGRSIWPRPQAAASTSEKRRLVSARTRRCGSPTPPRGQTLPPRSQAGNLLGVLVDGPVVSPDGVTADDRAQDAFRLRFAATRRTRMRSTTSSCCFAARRRRARATEPGTGAGSRGHGRRGAGAGTPGRGY